MAKLDHIKRFQLLEVWLNAYVDDLVSNPFFAGCILAEKEGVEVLPCSVHLSRRWSRFVGDKEVA